MQRYELFYMRPILFPHSDWAPLRNGMGSLGERQRIPRDSLGKYIGRGRLWNLMSHCPFSILEKEEGGAGREADLCTGILIFSC